MRILLITLLLSTMVSADEPADRAAVEAVIHSLRTAEPAGALFTSDASSDLNQLRAIELNMTRTVHQPWSEVGPPALMINSVQFLSADAALVMANETQIGRITTRIPVVFALRKEGDQWKIAYLRVLQQRPVMLPARVPR